MKSFRYYQEEANQVISEELLINDKCLVKMFCGTGKSLLMRNCDAVKDKKLVVYVFPSLPLIDQFVSDYLFDFEDKINISSEKESTTDPRKIIKFLKNENNKIICVTYQSFNILIDCLDSLEKKINTCCFDEAHHAVGLTYQQLIFQNDKCEKQIFFTATPKNANGIIMYDYNNLDLNMCGKLVYDYSYMKGLNEGYLNPFEIRLDLYTENSNQSIYECIARAILASGNTRVLTFHSDVSEESESETSVLNFVKEELFIHAFQKIQREEFPRNKFKLKKMVALHSNISAKDKKKILKEFDNCSKNNIYIISSCETIGEGIDTKNANMCVFVDPKSSYIKIIQNIGRIVRKSDNPLSTILIPCWIDKSKYIECEGDKEKCDEIIREDMNKQGNFNGILNVICALKQEDEDIYHICLHYPDRFSPMEIENNLKQQGYTISSSNNDLMETLEGVLGKELDFEEYEYEDDNDLIRQIAKKNNVCVVIHTDSLEETIITYNEGDKPMIRLLRTEEDEEIKYQEIISTLTNTTSIKPPSRENRLKLKVNTNPDIKVFWGITSDIDLTKTFCSCVIDCEVVDMWEENFEKLKEFIDEHKRRPIKERLTEKQLGQWLSNQIKNYKNKIQSMKKADRYQKWSEFLEEYKEYFKDFDEIWNETLKKLKLFMDENKRRPYEKQFENQFEKQLGKWLSHQIKNYKNKTQGMKDEVRFQKWSDFLEEYKVYIKDNYEKWNDNFDKLKLFIDENNRTPITDKEELGRWLSVQQRDYKNETQGMKDPDRRKLWSEFIKKYNIKNKDEVLDEEWNNNFEKLKEFINNTNNKRTPSPTSINVKEKELSSWLSNQQNKYKNKTQGMKDEVRFQKWSDFLEEYKEYFKTNDEIWNNNFEKLKEFINNTNNKRTPSQIAKDETEKYLGRWLVNQKQNYRKRIKSMNNESNYNQWTEFLEEYKEYFEKDKPTKKKSMKLATTTEEEKIIVNETTLTQRKPCPKSQLSLLHKEYKTLRSDNLNHKFKENPQLWEDYHRIVEENEKSYPEEGIPRNRIIEELKQIKTKRTKKVVDMGCGKGFISKYFKDDKRFEFTNLDHISSDETIISCDISKSDFEDDEVEICILSLAMWGSNCREYITEAYRILESGGRLYIIEPTKRWSEKEEGEFGKVIQGTEAIKLKQLLEENNFSIIKEEIEKFCLFVCVK
jgi:superfamily II DNA or RNA helicase